MTKLLEKAIETVRRLPDADQDEAAEMLLSAFSDEAPGYQLTPDQVETVRRTQAAVRDGKIATADEMTALWKKCGL